MSLPKTCYPLQQWVSCFILLAILCASCHTTKPRSKSYKKQIETSPVFQKAFTGFALFDPVKEQLLYQYQADKYFTPASNTKLFTLYTALNILGDSLVGLRYYQSGDSLVFVGAGDPSTLHPYLPKDSTLILFLKRHPKQLYFCTANFQEPHFGPGWAWDDYPYYYQPEKSPMPIYGNVVHIQAIPGQDSFQVSPGYFENAIVPKPELGRNSFWIKRARNQNQFYFNGKPLPSNGYDRELPFQYSDSLLIDLLETATQREVYLLEQCPIRNERFQPLYTIPVDTVYAWMMQESDNFIAEQLLLACSAQLFDTLNSRMLIDYATEALLYDLPDTPIWKDGSGLSRYNLFTPRSIVALLHKLYQEVPTERLLRIFPAGGQSGTIRNWYGGLDKPYVFAKTGTLSNKHCLSGFIQTKKGKLLIFSFMHNNYVDGSRVYKKEMERILLNIYSSY